MNLCEVNSRLWQRFVTVPAFILVLMGGTTHAFAQESNFKFTLGLKGWINDWETSNLFQGSILSTTGNKIAAIPSATVSYKNFFVTGGYFIKNSYGFPDSSTVVNNGGVPTTVTLHQTADRKEGDLNVGWYFIPQVAVTLGYKDVRLNKTKSSTPGILVSHSEELKVHAATFGIQGSARIGESAFFLYGNRASSLPNGAKATAPGGSANGSFGSTEVGGGYQFSNNLSVTLGYKYQIIDLSVGGLRARDVTSGAILGANYTF